ncbi:hypothetical protein [Chryseobacterium oranimense]|uniref:hypothetical protein n=1 Tax=Chryseobacterium oranimense TaxID=421058 RepID=UPI0031DA624A
METVYIENPKEYFDEIEKLISVVFEGFMALAMDYGYHINNVFGQSDKGKHTIYELRDNIHYRLNSSKLHFYLLLRRKIEIEQKFSEMLEKNPTVFNGFFMGNPHFDHASDEIMSIYDSIIFHLSSAFDYLAMMLQFVFGKNPQSNLQWITLAKHCYSEVSDFNNKKFKENIKNVDREFVSKFNDYRAELIHRKKSSSFANVSWKLLSGEIDTKFICSEKIKSSFKKILDKEKNYCITYITYLLIKQTVLNIGIVLEGVEREFKENYNPHSPILNNGGFQIISMNPETKYAESPSNDYWRKFNEYKNFY